MIQHGYAGSLLRVDVSTGKATYEPTDTYSGRFIGGRGMALKIYWDEVGPDIDPLHEDNKMIFALGPLAGIPALGGSRWGIFGKSPLNGLDRFNYGNLGGSWGAELKFAGLDGVILQGKSDKPVYIIIKNGTAEIHDASELWGMDTFATRTRLKEKHGNAVKVVSIGPAGENCVSTAILFAEGDASGSGGLGAVMGSKKVKALVVAPEHRKEMSIACPDKLRDIAREIRAIERGNTKVWGMDFMAQGEQTKKSPCYGCMAHCLRVDYTAEDGHKGKFMCQSRFFYFGHALMHYLKETDVPFKANKLCDYYGLDTWTLQDTLDWLLRCHQAGILSEEETGLPFSQVGSLEFIEKLVAMISLKQGFGEVVALGAQNAARKLGPAFEEQIKHIDAYEPRMYTINTLLVPFEPRVPIQQIHEGGLTLAQWATWAKGDETMHITSDVVKGIAKAFWGGEAAADMTTFDGKALAAKLIQDRQYVKESLVLCDWMYPVMDKPKADNHVGDPTVESRVYSAVMGGETSPEELSSYGERAFNLQRAVLLREGHRARLDDMLPDEWHDEPIAGHVADPDCLAPGKDGTPRSMLGRRVERGPYMKLLEEYYQIRGWDPVTGLQTKQGLDEIDLTDIVNTLDKEKLLA